MMTARAMSGIFHTDNSPRLLVVVLSIFFALPFLASMNLPFAYWDWLMVPYYNLQNQAYTWSALPSNLFFSLFLDPVQMRPVSSMLFNIQYIVFGGEFWLWYALKWAFFAIILYCLYRSVHHVTKSANAALVTVAVFAFHPMPTVSDVMSSDTNVAFFGSITIYWLFVKCGYDLERAALGTWNIGALSRKSWLVFAMFLTLTTLSKEIGVAFLAAMIVLLVMSSRRDLTSGLWIRIALLVALLVLVVIRVLGGVQHPTSKLTGAGLDKIMSLLNLIWTISIEVFQRYLFPASVLHLLTIASVLIILFGTVAALLFHRKYLPPLIFAVCGVAGSLPIIGLAHACPRYLETPVMFLALYIGVGFAAIEATISAAVLARYPQVSSSAASAGLRRGGTRILALLFAALMLVSGAPKIYSQWLGMVQSMYEMSDTIHFMETRHRQGFELRWTGREVPGELPGETGVTYEEFFNRLSVQLYGYREPIPFTSLRAGGLPANPKFVLLTSLTPDSVSKGALASLGINSLNGVQHVYSFERERYGALERVTHILKRFDRRFGVSLYDPIDCQPPHPSRFGPGMVNVAHSYVYFPLHAGPHLLYVFDKTAGASCAARPTNTKIELLPSLRRYGGVTR